MILQIKKLVDGATIPTRAHNTDAGLDLYSLDNHFLEYGERRLIKTGIAMRLPQGCYGRIAGRSGNALNKGLDVLAGVIDEGYTGEISAMIINLKQEPFVSFKKQAVIKETRCDIVFIKKGEKIAQLIIEKYYVPEIQIVDELEQTERSNKGFGSTD